MTHFFFIFDISNKEKKMSSPQQQFNANLQQIDREIKTFLQNYQQFRKSHPEYPTYHVDDINLFLFLFPTIQLDISKFAMFLKNKAEFLQNYKTFRQHSSSKYPKPTPNELRKAIGNFLRYTTTSKNQSLRRFSSSLLSESQQSSQRQYTKIIQEFADYVKGGVEGIQSSMSKKQKGTAVHYQDGTVRSFHWYTLPNGNRIYTQVIDGQQSRKNSLTQQQFRALLSQKKGGAHPITSLSGSGSGGGGGGGGGSNVTQEPQKKQKSFDINDFFV